jgi:glutamate/tyrosine decarboxylase-like PLP-dependent enzyme
MSHLVQDELSGPFHSLVRILERMMREESQSPVEPPLGPEHARREWSFQPPRDPRPWEDVAADLESLALRGPRTTTRAFFNQLFGGRLGSAVVADMLVSLLNQSMYTYKVAGPQVLVERALIDHMGRRVGYSEPDGTFAPGGSLSNLVAMVVARNEAFPEARSQGLLGRRPMLYVSAEGHYSIRKNAGVIGLGRERVKVVPVDDHGRMDPTALARQVRRDRDQGAEPFLVVATAGTTVRGAFDPIDQLATVAEEEGLWLHVDGAFGGSMLLSERAKPRLAGSEQADSFTWDAHKLMGVPLTSSVLLLRERGLLDRHLSEDADYLFQGDAEPSLDPGHRSLQCGRRNDALKLWAAWQRHGDAGFEARIDRCLELAAFCARAVEARPRFRLTEPPASVNVCFEVVGADPDDVVTRLNAEGRAVVGTAQVAGRRVIRWVAVNPELAEEDVLDFLDAVQAAAGEDAA